MCCRAGGGGECGGAELHLPAGGGPEHRQCQVVPQHHRDIQDRAGALRTQVTITLRYH